MAFSRILFPVEWERDSVTRSMVGIGMNFAAEPAKTPNIEDTLLFASREGMERDDLRVLAVLVTWFGVHARYVNADRLTKLVREEQSVRVRGLWAAFGRWQATDPRFKRLARAYRGPRIELLRVGTAFQVSKHGEDQRFSGGPLIVPANVLRDRPADVLTPSELAARHAAYRYRVMMGPSYRADMWAALLETPTLSASELARRTYGSFAPAWSCRKDFGVLKAAYAKDCA